MIMIYYLTGKKLIFKDYDFVTNNKNNNIVFEHFRSDEGYVIVPINYIILGIWMILF